MTSDEDLQDIASVDDWYMGVHLGDMAKELLELRKAFSETAVYEAEINGVMSSVTKSHYEDCKKYGVKTRELIVKPTPPQ